MPSAGVADALVANAFTEISGGSPAALIAATLIAATLIAAALIAAMLAAGVLAALRRCRCATVEHGLRLDDRSLALD